VFSSSCEARRASSLCISARALFTSSTAHFWSKSVQTSRILARYKTSFCNSVTSSRTRSNNSRNSLSSNFACALFCSYSSYRRTSSSSAVPALAATSAEKCCIDSYLC
jgi:hypothetical protein